MNLENKIQNLTRYSIEELKERYINLGYNYNECSTITKEEFALAIAKFEARKCAKEFECKGNCSLNVAGSFDVWHAVSNHCSGTKEEQNLIGDIFNKNKSKEIILSKYSFTDIEKNIVKGHW